MAQKIQIRRGLEVQRTTIIPDVGEPLFTTDNKQLFIGDGVTPGGQPIVGTSATFLPKIRGTLPIPASTNVVAVSGLTLGAVPAQVLVTMRKVTGGLNLFATVRDDTVSAAGFTVDLSATTDVATYKLDYLIIL